MLDAAVAAVASDGVADLRLREVSRAVGVSHTAAAHHFGDKAGLLTAIAVEGFELLADALADATTGSRAGTGTFADAGVAYVRFATSRPGHFAVMFRPDLLHLDDPGLVAARERAGTALRAGAGSGSSVEGLAAWSLVHGLATLWLSGAAPRPADHDVEATARAVVRRLRTD
jgi:AcrR family transcriptional regulator